MRRITIVISARASYARILTAIEAMHEHPNLDIHLAFVGSCIVEQYGNCSTILDSLLLKNSVRFHTLLDPSNPTSAPKTTALTLIELSSYFSTIQPDAVITIADRYETIATAIASSYMNIPLIHLQGGEVTGNIDEKVRHAVTKLADIHLVCTKASKERLIKMGEKPTSVFLTGCPSIDLARKVLDLPKITNEQMGLPIDLNSPYLTVLVHPSTYSQHTNSAETAIVKNALQMIGLPIIWFTPNADWGTSTIKSELNKNDINTPNNTIHFVHNLPPVHFLQLITHSSCLVGNSSVGIREASYLGIPVVNIGTRQAGRERASNVLDVDFNKKQIFNGILSQLKHGKYPSSTLYGDGHSGKIVADILANVVLTSEKKISY